MLVTALSRLRRSRVRCVMSVTQGCAGTLPPMSKRRLDTLLAERGLYESRSRAAAAVMAGDVRVGERPARKPGELVSADAELEVARAARLRLARRRQAGERPRRLRDRPGRAPGARRGRLHRRLQRLPAPARGGVRDRARRGLRGAALVAAPGPARDGDRAQQRAGARPRRRCPTRRTWWWPTCRSSRSPRSCPPCSAARRRPSTAWRWSSPSSRWAASAWAGAGWCAPPPSGARRWSPWPRACGRRPGRRCSALPRPACPARPATARASSGWPRPAARGAAGADLEAAARVAEP